MSFIEPYNSKPINKIAALGFAYGPDTTEDIVNEQFAEVYPLMDVLDRIAKSLKPSQPLTKREEKVITRALKTKVRKKMGRRPVAIKKDIFKQAINVEAKALLQSEIRNRESRLQQQMKRMREQLYPALLDMLADCMKKEANLSTYIINAFTNRCLSLFSTCDPAADVIDFKDRAVDLIRKNDLRHLHDANVTALEGSRIT